MMTSSIPVAVLILSTGIAAPPAQNSVTTVLGPKAYRDGDVIEITDVRATSGDLEQGDSVTVKGRYRLQSRQTAKLCLYLTQTESSVSTKTEPRQRMLVTNGLGEFELKTTIKHRGVLHLTFYDQSSGRPIGGTYFGTADQMQAIADWDVSYYLRSDDEPQQSGYFKSHIEQQIERYRRELRMLERYRQKLQEAGRDPI